MDLNRQFYNTNSYLFPTVAGLKQMIAETKKTYKENFVLFLDLHSHSVRKNIFMYAPRFPIDDIRYYTI
jgi:cytosolic carboxypeptidase protein 2/3